MLISCPDDSEQLDGSSAIPLNISHRCVRKDDLGRYRRDKQWNSRYHQKRYPEIQIVGKTQKVGILGVGVWEEVKSRYDGSMVVVSHWFWRLMRSRMVSRSEERRIIRIYEMRRD